jgi:hypothetical protein
MVRGSLLVGLGLVVAACGMPRYVKTAYFGNLADLKRDIAAATRAGQMDRAGVVDLAEAVARREVRSAKGPDALERIRESRACIRSVEFEIRERAKASDDAGAAALMSLLEAGLVERGRMIDLHARASNGAFRAVAARASVSPERGELRRAFFSDPDERVRGAALRAAQEARDSDDFELLFEAARLDPNGDNRALSTRALGATGSERAALVLKDLWSSADQLRRLAIIDAWSASRIFSTGGAEELLRVAESQQSLESAAAAAALLRIGRAGAREGRAVLIRSVAEGTSEQRTVAISFVPLDSDGLAALDRAAKADDVTVRVTALERLLDAPARKAKALSTLEDLAKGADGAARQAKGALARAGDRKIAPLLEKDLAVGPPSHRRQVALGLFQMGRAPAMAASLADPDPSVRMSVACSVLADEDRPPSRSAI